MDRFPAAAVIPAAPGWEGGLGETWGRIVARAESEDADAALDYWMRGSRRSTSRDGDRELAERAAFVPQPGLCRCSYRPRRR
jgi:hypothetical protein